MCLFATLPVMVILGTQLMDSYCFVSHTIVVLLSELS